MKFLRGHAGLLFTVIIFLGFTFWLGSFLNSGGLSSPNPSVSGPVAPPASQIPAAGSIPAQTNPQSSPTTWANKEFRNLNLKFDAPDGFNQSADGELPGVRFTNPANSRQLVGMRVHPKNAESRVRGVIIASNEKPVVVGGVAGTELTAKRKNADGSLDMLLVKQFGKLYEFYGQEIEFSRMVKTLAFIAGDLPAVKNYQTTGCNIAVDYPSAWATKEIFGPPGAATIIGFDPKPIPESGETSGKLQISCLTGEQAARYHANFVAFHKEVKEEKIPVGPFEALKVTGLVPEDAPAAAGERRAQVIFEHNDRTHIITYTSPKDSFDKDLQGLNTILDTIEVQ